jgi:hypothetical protein
LATDATGTPTALGIPKVDPNIDAPSGLGTNAAMDAIDTLLTSRAQETLTRNDALALQLSGASGGLTIGGDTNLYREAGNTLKTDDAFVVAQGGGRLVFNTNSITFGAAGDANLYRPSAGALKTDGDMHVAGVLLGRPSTAGQVKVAQSGSVATITFGSADDTSLYRTGAGILETAGQFNALGVLYFGGQFRVGTALGSGGAVSGAQKAMPVYNGAGTLQGYVPVYATYA